jgi:Nif-specific regulatory protein
LEKIAKEYGKRLQLSDECLQILMEYRWPGNVRELENVIESVCIMAEGSLIKKTNLPDYLMRKRWMNFSSGDSCSSRIEEMEKQTMVEALQENDWIQQKAAKKIGITLRQMGYRVKKYNLDEIIRKERKKIMAMKKK